MSRNKLQFPKLAASMILPIILTCLFACPDGTDLSARENVSKSNIINETNFSDAGIFDSGQGTEPSHPQQQMGISPRLVNSFLRYLNSASHGGVLEFSVKTCAAGIEDVNGFGKQIVTRCTIENPKIVQTNNCDWVVPSQVSYLGGTTKTDGQWVEDGVTLIPGKRYLALLGNDPEKIGFGGSSFGVIDLSTNNISDAEIFKNAKRREALLQAIQTGGGL